VAHISLWPFKHVVPNGTYFIEEEDQSDSQERAASWSASPKPQLSVQMRPLVHFLFAEDSKSHCSVFPPPFAHPNIWIPHVPKMSGKVPRQTGLSGSAS